MACLVLPEVPVEIQKPDMKFEYPDEAQGFVPPPRFFFGSASWALFGAGLVL